MKSYSFSESQIYNDSILTSIINPFVNYVNDYEEVMGSMTEMHKNSNGYPESMASFYFIFNSQYSRKLYVSKSDKLSKVLKKLVYFPFYLYIFIYKEKVLTATELNSTIAQLLANKTIDIVFYIVAVLQYSYEYPKSNNYVESKVNYPFDKDLSMKVFKCVESRKDPLKQIKSLVSFERDAPVFKLEYLAANIFYERLLFDIGTQTGDKKCIYKSTDKKGIDVKSYLSGFFGMEHWVKNMVEIRNNMEKMKTIKTDTSFYLWHIGWSDRLYVDKNKILKDALQEVLEMKASACTCQYGTHFFSSSELNTTIKKLIEKKIIPNTFHVCVDGVTRDVARKVHPNPIVPEKPTFYDYISQDVCFLQHIRRYTESCGTQCQFENPEEF